MTNDAKIWIEISRTFLLHAIDSIKRVKKGQEKKDLLMWFEGGEVCMGIDYRPTIKYPGEGNCPGTIRVPFHYMLTLLKVEPVNTPVRFEFVDGKIHMESARWPAVFMPRA